MPFLAIGHVTPGADIAPHLPAEQQRVKELREAGLVEQFYVKADRSGAVFVLAADTAAAAQEGLDTLPFVQGGLMSFELTELVDPATAG